MIKLQIIGNLGKDAAVNTVNGRNVINFSVAHKEKFKDAQGNPKERTTWVECAYWTDRTAVVPYLKKGTMVFAEGSPEADAYMNRENQAAATLRMRVQTVQLLGGNNNNQQQSGENAGSFSASNQNAYQPNNNAFNGNNSNASNMSMMDVADDLPF